MNINWNDDVKSTISRIVFMGWRDRTLHCALLRTVLDCNIRFGATNKHTALPCKWQS